MTDVTLINQGMQIDFKKEWMGDECPESLGGGWEGWLEMHQLILILVVSMRISYSHIFRKMINIKFDDDVMKPITPHAVDRKCRGMYCSAEPSFCKSKYSVE